MIPSRRRHVFGVLSSNNRVQIRMLPCARSLAGAAFTGVSIPGYRETRRVRGPWARASTRQAVPDRARCVAYLAHRTLAPARWRLAPTSPPCRFSAEARSMRRLGPICDCAFDSRPMRRRSRFASARLRHGCALTASRARGAPMPGLFRAALWGSPDSSPFRSILALSRTRGTT